MKIFCIGLNKTATSSIVQAWYILGYTKVCSPDLRMKGLNLAAFNKNYNLIFKMIDNFDCFKDRPFNTERLYKILDQHFLDSKFILTVRDEDEWWISVSRWLNNLVPTHHITEADRLYKIEMYKRHFETDKFTKESFTKYYREYNQEVRDYFKNNPNFLEMNICEGDGWEKLCPFLDKPIPNTPFPRINVNNFEHII